MFCHSSKTPFFSCFLLEGLRSLFFSLKYPKFVLLDSSQQTLPAPNFNCFLLQNLLLELPVHYGFLSCWSCPLLLNYRRPVEVVVILSDSITINQQVFRNVTSTSIFSYSPMSPLPSWCFTIRTMHSVW